MQQTAPVLISSHVGLRGVAALLVVFYHNYFLPNHLPFEDWNKFFARGYLMVDLFFILSGFIMLHVYKEIRLNQDSYYDFFVKRLARIYPLHVVSLLGLLCAKILLFILYWIDGKSAEAFWRVPGTWEAFVAQLILIHSFLPTEPGWNIPSWSISAEMFAYLLFPLVAVLLRRYVRTTSALMLLFSVSYYGVAASTTGSLDVTHGSAPARCLAGFLAGMLINHYARQMLPSNQPLILSFVQCLTIVFICILLSVEVNDIFVIPFFIVLVATTMNDYGIISNIMSRKIFQFLGSGPIDVIGSM
jgi:Predicted acyltransferases